MTEMPEREQCGHCGTWIFGWSLAEIGYACDSVDVALRDERELGESGA